MRHPDQIGRYSIVGVIGEGGMGVVYKGFDPVLQRHVAIKTVLSRLLDDEELDGMLRVRFKTEAQAAGRLTHPNIVAIHEFNQDSDPAYIVMELVDGPSLRDILRQRIDLPESEVVGVMSQLLNALDYAHEHGVLHRDVKPGNLLFTRSGRLKITDFGIARIESGAMTRTRSAIGSPAYMAPEQFLESDVDRRVDVFAAGVIFYHLLAGQLPFSGTDQQIMFKVVHEQPGPPSQVRGRGEWSCYDAVVLKALEKSPALRYETAARFLEGILAVYRDPGRDVGTEETVITRLARSGLQVRREANGGGTGNSAVGATPSSTGSAASPTGPATSDRLASPVPNGAPTEPAWNIRPVPGPAGASGAPVPASSGARATPITNTTPTGVTGWDNDTLTGLERELAQYIGPMAKVLVKKAAAQSADLATLRTKLASQLTSQDDAKKFLRAGVGAAPAAAGGAGVAGGTNGTSGFSAADLPLAVDANALTPELQERLTRALVDQIGPIGKAIAKKAATEARTRGEFVAAVTRMLRVGGQDVAAQLMKVR